MTDYRIYNDDQTAKPSSHQRNIGILLSMIVVIFLIVSMVLLAKALNKGIPVGTAYAVWTGIGAVGTITLSVALGNETLTMMKTLFVSMIIAGIIGLQITSKTSE